MLLAYSPVTEEISSATHVRRVARLPDQSLVSVYYSGSPTEVYFQISEPDGQLRGPAIRASTESQLFKVDADVEVAGNHIVVAWRQLATISDSLRARRFDFSGTPIGAEVVLSDYSPGNGGSKAPSLAVAPNGATAVAWCEPGGMAVFRMLAPDGSLGPLRQVGGNMPAREIHEAKFDDSGRLTLLWGTMAGGGVVNNPLYAGRFDMDGVALFAPITLIAGTSQGIHAAADVDGHGNLICAYNGSLRRYDATGVPLGPATAIGTTYEYVQLHAEDDGRFSIAHSLGSVSSSSSKRTWLETYTSQATFDQRFILDDGPGTTRVPLAIFGETDGAIQLATTASDAMSGGLGLNLRKFDYFTDPGSLDVRVWRDLSADGRQDVGEPNYTSTTVRLFNQFSFEVQAIALGSTPYLFRNLKPGAAYFIKIDVGTSAYLSRVLPGIPPDLDSDVDPTTGASLPFTVQPGQTRDDIDAGYVFSGAIRPRYFDDYDGDSTKDANEPEVRGRSVLLDVDFSGTPTSPDVPLAPAATRFEKLYPSTYSILPVPQQGWTTPEPAQVAVGFGQTADVWLACITSVRSPKPLSTSATPLVVAPVTADTQPRIGVSQAGSVVVSWYTPSFNTTARIAARVYETNGQPRSAEIEIDATGRSAPALSVRPDGTFAVAWINSASRLAVRLYSADGQPISPATLVDGETAAASSSSPAIASDASGRFVIAWGAANQIYFRRLGATGLIESATMLADTQSGNEPALAAADDGRIALAWYSYNLDLLAYQIRARWFDTHLNALGTAVTVNQSSTGPRYNPDITLDNAGRSVVSWWGRHPSGQSDFTVVRKFQAPGIPLGDEVYLNAALTAPPAALSSLGDVAVIARDTSNGINFQTTVFGPTGSVGGAFRVQPNGQNAASYADLVFGADRSIWIAYVTSSPSANLYVQRWETRPQVLANWFHYDSPSQSLGIVFSENVADVPIEQRIRIENLQTGDVIDATDLAMNFDVAAGIALISWPGLASGVLPDGNYRASLASFDVQDPLGNPLSSDMVMDFFVLEGDANRDRSVNISDFGILAANFNQPGTFSSGDFNYSSVVDISDFSLLARNFNASLPSTSFKVFAAPTFDVRQERAQQSSIRGSLGVAALSNTETDRPIDLLELRG